MSQHDFNIANQTFPSFRSDLNDALQAAATISAGATAPTTPYAYQLWYDTANEKYMIRNAANSAWLNFVGIDTNGNVDVTGQIDVNSAARIDSSGIVKAANGTEASPTHSFLNDPDNGMFRATTNTIGFSTAGTERLRITAGSVGINQTSPLRSLHVVDDSADPLIVERSTTGNTAIRVTDDTDTVYFGMPTGGGFAVDDDANLADGPWLKIDTSGTVRKPYQPSFSVVKTSDQTLSTTANTTITWETELWDTNSDFTKSTNLFTAPVTGKYYLQAQARIDNFDTAAGHYQFQIVTSNRTRQEIIDPNFTSDLTYSTMSLSGVFDMDAGDTAYVSINQNGGTASHVEDGQSYTSFSGYLLG